MACVKKRYSGTSSVRSINTFRVIIRNALCYLDSRYLSHLSSSSDYNLRRGCVWKTEPLPLSLAFKYDVMIAKCIFPTNLFHFSYIKRRLEKSKLPRKIFTRAHTVTSSKIHHHRTLTFKSPFKHLQFYKNTYIIFWKILMMCTRNMYVYTKIICFKAHFSSTCRRLWCMCSVHVVHVCGEVRKHIHIYTWNICLCFKKRFFLYISYFFTV